VIEEASQESRLSISSMENNQFDEEDDEQEKGF